MEDEIGLDFNFWPSFADLMLALVLILVLVLFLVTAVITIGTINLTRVEGNQNDMIHTIAASYRSEPKTLKTDLFGISTKHSDSYDIVIQNEPVLQRITFSDQILFTPNDYRINAQGQDVLRIVGDALKEQLPLIREIQIQGHADTDPTDRYPSNVHLAALRAIEVFRFLQNSTGINPAEHLMSATSFGEFRPIQRSPAGDSFNQEELQRDNATLDLKAQNRRIELLLFYRLQ